MNVEQKAFIARFTKEERLADLERATLDALKGASYFRPLAGYELYRKLKLTEYEANALFCYLREVKKVPIMSTKKGFFVAKTSFEMEVVILRLRLAGKVDSDYFRSLSDLFTEVRAEEYRNYAKPSAKVEEPLAAIFEEAS